MRALVRKTSIGLFCSFHQTSVVKLYPAVIKTQWLDGDPLESHQATWGIPEPHSEQTPKQVTQTSVFIVSQSTNELLTSIWSQGVHMI